MATRSDYSRKTKPKNSRVDICGETLSRPVSSVCRQNEPDDGAQPKRSFFCARGGQCWEPFLFFCWASTKERTRQPPPNLETIVKHNWCARAPKRSYSRAILQMLFNKFCMYVQFYNAILQVQLLKLCSLNRIANACSCFLNICSYLNLRRLLMALVNSFICNSCPSMYVCRLENEFLDRNAIR
jgi:hypothetical protein